MSWTIWITGAPGSSASSVAQAAARQLTERGVPVQLLRLDTICTALTSPTAHADPASEIVGRVLVFMATALTDAGVPVIVDAGAPGRAWRTLARTSLPRFAEVELAGPPTGTEPEPYEPGPRAELTVDAAVEDAQSTTARVVALALTLGPVTAPREPRGGAVLWLTGPPGSGKTTLATRLAEQLAGEGVPVSLLEWTVLRGAVLPSSWATTHAEEITHRALAYTAKLLADSGRVVVVDATTARRAWRALARELIATFAEVQLVCPLHVCLERERAVRWHPRSTTVGEVVAVAPDVALEYEYSLNPDLILDTETRSEWTAAEDLIAFARRLLDRPATG